MKRKTLFDHLNSITLKKQPNYYKDLSDEDKKTFNVYMIHRFLSMNPNWIEMVNYVQKYSQQLKQKNTFRLYDEIIPKGKIFLKYVKSKNEKDYNEDVLNILVKFFEVSTLQAKEYHDILLRTVDGRNYLIDIIKMYGGTEKEIKKMTKSLKVSTLGE